MRPFLLGFVAAATASGQAPLQVRVQRALERARPMVMAGLDSPLNGELALACLAALHDGVEHDNAQLTSAIARLRAARELDTYGLALRLMVMAEMPSFADCVGRASGKRAALEHKRDGEAGATRAQLAAADCRELLQHFGGTGFSYQRTGRGDLSNTQYGALGLRAAAQLGVRVEAREWRRLGEVVRGVQADDGGFGYGMERQSSQPSTPSMTVAGIGVLEICCEQLPKSNLAPALRHPIQRGWRWMEAHASAIGGFKRLHCLYFHYGLERAAILSSKELIGAVDWYAKGAEMLLARQQPDGSWTDQPNPAQVLCPHDTSFAVLFLRRKFHRANTPTTGSGYAIRGLPEQATAAEIAQAIANEKELGERAIEKLLIELHSTVRTRRVAAARAIASITGQTFDLGEDPSDTPEGVRAAELWWLERARLKSSGGANAVGDKDR